jgi:hypothetical protein
MGKKILVLTASGRKIDIVDYLKYVAGVFDKKQGT